jgi:hypothetical protein
MKQIARNLSSIKSECLAQIIPLGECHLREDVKEYTEYGTSSAITRA